MKSEMKKMKIYLDMDGVIADFFGALANFYGVSHWRDLPNKEQNIIALGNTNFFSTLPKFETSDELVDFIHERTDGEWAICSTPLCNDDENSIYHKTVWLEKMGYKPAAKIFTHTKEDYAVNPDGSPNILIDDRKENIENWINKGGIGILYQANQNSIDELKDRIDAQLCVA